MSDKFYSIIPLKQLKFCVTIAPNNSTAKHQSIIIPTTRDFLSIYEPISVATAAVVGSGSSETNTRNFTVRMFTEY